MTATSGLHTSDRFIFVLDKLCHGRSRGLRHHTQLAAQHYQTLQMGRLSRLQLAEALASQGAADRGKHGPDAQQARMSVLARAPCPHEGTPDVMRVTV